MLLSVRSCAEPMTQLCTVNVKLTLNLPRSISRTLRTILVKLHSTVPFSVQNPWLSYTHPRSRLLRCSGILCSGGFSCPSDCCLVPIMFQDPELQCLLRVKEDLSIDFSGCEKWCLKLFKIKNSFNFSEDHNDIFDHKYHIDPRKLLSI